MIFIQKNPKHTTQNKIKTPMPLIATGGDLLRHSEDHVEVWAKVLEMTETWQNQPQTGPWVYMFLASPPAEEDAEVQSSMTHLKS